MFNIKNKYFFSPLHGRKDNNEINGGESLILIITVLGCFPPYVTVSVVRVVYPEL